VAIGLHDEIGKSRRETTGLKINVVEFEKSIRGKNWETETTMNMNNFEEKRPRL